MNRTGESAFETVIEAHLLGNGYVSVPGRGFDRERAVFPEVALGFIRETQPDAWTRLEALLGERTGEQVLADLCKWMDRNGALATLRHGFKCYGRTLRIAFFKAAHALNPELEARYAANHVGLTRQLRFSPRSEQSVDVTLSLNGIPVSTLELKNPLTGQTVEDARGQYRRDRDPREPIFEFKRRTLVHFAVDTESVLMTTRLAGAATHFLPFDKGCDGGAGNPPDPQGRGYRTAYLWEEVLARDSLLDLLARFVHLQTGEKRDDKGRKVKVETMIFPRYHQLEAVRRLVDTARREGVGHNALVEHSAGSGKSNTIAWLTHRLASLHDAQNARVFDSVIVVTDRVVLDSQLQDTIYQFEHKRGVVQKIDESSRQLAEALEGAVPIVITTLQKFPFVSRQLLRMAEERGTEAAAEAGTESGTSTEIGTKTGSGSGSELGSGTSTGTGTGTKTRSRTNTGSGIRFGSGSGTGLGTGSRAGTLPTRRYAVVIDEAHSSQGGETATALKEVLGGEALREKARKRAAEEGLEGDGPDDPNDPNDPDGLEALFLGMAKRGRQANLSFFAFTATPKHRTLKVFGRGGEPAHRYTMRQAIEEGFILDVLKHYTSYATYYKLLKACEDDPNVERKRAARALARFVRLHPHNVAQKTEVMVEHFHSATRHRIGGRAKAMVVTGSRLEAVRYKQSFDRYIEDRGYAIKSLVAFSGIVRDDRDPDLAWTEEKMNEGVREKELPEHFATGEYQVLLVAEKYQTGFDQPLLHTMYVDKRLAGIQAVQTLSRLNRTHPFKEDTFVLDFVNGRDEIREAFKTYYEGAEMGDEADPARMYAIREELDASGIYLGEEVERFCKIFFKPRQRQSPRDHQAMNAALDPAVSRFAALHKEREEEAELWRGKVQAFRNLYGFLSQVIPYQDSDLERLYTWLRHLAAKLPRRRSGPAYQFDDDVRLQYYRLRKISEGSIPLGQGGARALDGPTEVGSGMAREQAAPLSRLIDVVNERFGTDFNDADQLFFDQIVEAAVADDALRETAAINPEDKFELVFGTLIERLFTERMDQNEEIFIRYMNDEPFHRTVSRWMATEAYRRLRPAGLIGSGGLAGPGEMAGPSEMAGPGGLIGRGGLSESGEPAGSVGPSAPTAMDKPAGLAESDGIASEPTDGFPLPAGLRQARPEGIEAERTDGSSPPLGPLPLRPDEVGREAEASEPGGLRIVEGRPEERYVTCIPLVPLAIAAGAFGDPRSVEAEEDWKWVEVSSGRRLRPGMFVARITGRSMEPVIPDGAYGLFRSPVQGTRQGKTVLVQLRDATDPETGARYTVKRYESERVGDGDSWRHARITLKPNNPEFEPIVLTGMDEGEVAVVAELVDLVGVSVAMPAGIGEIGNDRD